MITKTNRLYLRELSEKDFEHFFYINTDPEVIRYTGDPPFPSLEAAKAFLSNYVSCYKTHGMGRWAVCLNRDDSMIGWCGLKYHPDKDIVDVGYRFYQKYWGQGYATEATKAVISYGFETLKLSKIVAHVHKDNIGSQKVALKSGLHFIKDFVYDKAPSKLYEIQNPICDPDKN